MWSGLPAGNDGLRAGVVLPPDSKRPGHTGIPGVRMIVGQVRQQAEILPIVVELEAGVPLNLRRDPERNARHWRLVAERERLDCAEYLLYRVGYIRRRASDARIPRDVIAQLQDRSPSHRQTPPQLP